MTAMIDVLAKAEVTGGLEADARRVLRDERMGIQAAMQRVESARSEVKRAERLGKSDPRRADAVYFAKVALEAAEQRVGAKINEAKRVAKMWGAEV